MANEPGPEEMRDLWRSQPVDPVRMSADEMRRKNLLCEGRMRRMVGLCITLSLSGLALYVWFFYLFPDTVTRIGLLLTFAGELSFLYQILKLRPARNQEVCATVAAYRAQLLHRHSFLLNLWWRFLLPFIPGPAVILLGFLIPERGVLLSVLLTSAYLASPSAVVIPLARRKARRIEREIAELDSQMG